MAENWLKKMKQEHSERARQQYNRKVPDKLKKPELAKETESDKMRREADAALDDMARQFANVGIAAKAAAKAFGTVPSKAPRVSRKFRISDQVAVHADMEKLRSTLLAMKARGDLEMWSVEQDNATFQTIITVVGKPDTCENLDLIITESFT